MTSSRDDRHRRAAQRLRTLAVELASEVRARGGNLDWYPDLTDEERAEAEQQARTFFPRRMVKVHLKMRKTVNEARRSDHLASTEHPLDG